MDLREVLQPLRYLPDLREEKPPIFSEEQSGLEVIVLFGQEVKDVREVDIGAVYPLFPFNILVSS